MRSVYVVNPPGNYITWRAGNVMSDDAVLYSEQISLHISLPEACHCFCIQQWIDIVPMSIRISLLSGYLLGIRLARSLAFGSNNHGNITQKCHIQQTTYRGYRGYIGPVLGLQWHGMAGLCRCRITSYTATSTTKHFCYVTL